MIESIFNRDILNHGADPELKARATINMRTARVEVSNNFPFLN